MAQPVTAALQALKLDGPSSNTASLPATSLAQTPTPAQPQAPPVLPQAAAGGPTHIPADAAAAGAAMPQLTILLPPTPCSEPSPLTAPSTCYAAVALPPGHALHHSQTWHPVMQPCPAQPGGQPVTYMLASPHPAQPLTYQPFASFPAPDGHSHAAYAHPSPHPQAQAYYVLVPAPASTTSQATAADCSSRSFQMQASSDFPQIHSSSLPEMSAHSCPQLPTNFMWTLQAAPPHATTMPHWPAASATTPGDAPPAGWLCTTLDSLPLQPLTSSHHHHLQQQPDNVPAASAQHQPAAPATPTAACAAKPSWLSDTGLCDQPQPTTPTQQLADDGPSQSQSQFYPAYICPTPGTASSAMDLGDQSAPGAMQGQQQQQQQDPLHDSKPGSTTAPAPHSGTSINVIDGANWKSWESFSSSTGWGALFTKREIALQGGEGECECGGYMVYTPYRAIQTGFRLMQFGVNVGFFILRLPPPPMNAEMSTVHFLFESREDYAWALDRWDSTSERTFVPDCSADWQFCNLDVNSGTWCHRVLVVRRTGSRTSERLVACAFRLMTFLAMGGSGISWENLALWVTKNIIAIARR